jgi:hypothetical protein
MRPNRSRAGHAARSFTAVACAALALALAGTATARAAEGARAPRICFGPCPPDTGPAWTPGAHLRLPPEPWRFVCPLRPAGGAPREVRSLDARLLRQTVRDHEGQVRWCYQQALLREPGLSGQLTLRLSVGTDGAVTAATVEDATLAADTGVAACVVERARGWRFPPAPEGTPVGLRYPFLLRAPDGAAPPSPPPTADAEDCPCAAAPPALADPIGRLERLLAALPGGTPLREGALREVAALHVGHADRLEQQALLDFLAGAEEADDRGELLAVAETRHAACLAAADEALARGLERLEQLAREFPAAADADRTLYASALLSAELGRGDDAEQRLARLLESFPTSRHAERARFLLAGLRLERGACEPARPLVAPLTAVVAGHEPTVAQGYLRYRLAWCALRRGDFAAALPELEAIARGLAGRPGPDPAWLRDAVEEDLLLAWSAAGDPARAPAALRALDPERAPALLARLARRYEEHGEHPAAIRLYRTLLTAAAPLERRLGWWRALVAALLRERDGRAALQELATGLDVLREARASTAERDAWMVLLVEATTRWVDEARQTHAPDALRSARAACDLAVERAALDERLLPAGLGCADFLLRVENDAPGALALLDRLAAGPLTADALAQAAALRVAARRVQLVCEADAPALPRTDALGEGRLTPAETVFVEAADRAVAAARAASPEPRRWTVSLSHAVAAARVHYDRNRWADAIPRLTAVVEADVGGGAAREAALPLLTACRLACDRACLDRWVPRLAERTDVRSDDLLAFVTWWRTRGPTDLAASCR